MDQPRQAPVDGGEFLTEARLLSDDLEPLLRDYYRLRLITFLRDYNHQCERAMRVRLADEQRARSRWQQAQRASASAAAPESARQPARLRWGLLLALLISLGVGGPLVASIDPPPALAYIVGAVWTLLLVRLSRRYVSGTSGS